MSDESKILDQVDSTGYKETTVGELLRELAILPPMMPIMGYEHSDNSWRYFNGLSIEETNVSILIFNMSEKPEAKRKTFEPTPEEQEAEKKHKALEMEKEKQAAQKA